MLLSTFYLYAIPSSLMGLPSARLPKEQSYAVEQYENSVYFVYSPIMKEEKKDPIDIISFGADEDSVTIFFAGEEPEHRNKLSLPEIFRGLCREEELDSYSMDWLIFDGLDVPAMDAIESYRESHKIGQTDEIDATPGSDAWKVLSELRYYTSATNMLPERILDRIIVRSQKWVEEDKDGNEKVKFSDRIHFFFEPVPDEDEE
ncbi:hypothetical protein CFIMG_007701RA00001 [Ceratocystis fimbriata CBS 114723]|uniref:Uncharacterized protein n=1 Tax=Ceratocystis fimbriata CBS 114723 TaxID=1035309 RepID=A0A2C5WVH8_9PEZI|nr:hypothetical protein CFIMG_007701RA00001 [Ceratocystis fimbriata CBS 114723]